MSLADIINGLFEISGGFFLWLNVYKLWKDKEVKGVSIISFSLFMLWGYWNLYYYPSLGQWASFVGGLVVVSGNTAWVVLAMKYRKKK